MTRDQHAEMSWLLDALIEQDPFDLIRSVTFCGQKIAVPMETLKAAREHHQELSYDRTPEPLA